MNTAANGKAAVPDVPVQGYCVRCRSRRDMHGAIQVTNSHNRHAITGHCAACGTSMYRLGGWDSLAAAPHNKPNENPNSE